MLLTLVCYFSIVTIEIDGQAHEMKSYKETGASLGPR